VWFFHSMARESDSGDDCSEVSVPETREARCVLKRMVNEGRLLDADGSLQILAVVVRYARPCSQSRTIEDLTIGFEKNPVLRESVAVLIWDNSPEPPGDAAGKPEFAYYRSAQNVGVARAYNQGMGLAESLDIPWLLLLDQDTTLPSEFLAKMLEYSRRVEHREEIAAIAPILFNGKKVSSPSIIRHGVSKCVDEGFRGVSESMVISLNSGTLVRVDALRAVGGFDERFWLDFSDIALQTVLFRNGKKVYVAGDIHLLHDTAIDDIEHAMSLHRYCNLLRAEGAYWDIFGEPAARLLHLARLAGRAMKQYLRFANKEFTRLTWVCLIERLVRPRKDRLAAWQQEARSHQGSVAVAATTTKELVRSVAYARGIRESPCSTGRSVTEDSKPSRSSSRMPASVHQ
jgi:GT2 family glycosyltransferase